MWGSGQVIEVLASQNCTLSCGVMQGYIGTMENNMESTSIDNLSRALRKPPNTRICGLLWVHSLGAGQRWQESQQALDHWRTSSYHMLLIEYRMCLLLVSH